jgi:hypothetical protein
MPQLIELASEITGEVPGLSHQFARKYINQALDSIQRDYLWSWNIGEGILITPGAIGTGTVSVTLYSNQVTFDSVAQATLLPFVLSNDPNPLIKRQFRLPNGPIYNILGYDPSTGIMTLDRIYTEPTDPTAIYAIYRCYYDPPSSDGIVPNYDFLRYLSILNPIQGYTISGRRLTQTREMLNRRDPLRGAQGYPYYAFAYKPTGNGAPSNGPTNGITQYELWPHPTFLQAYPAQYVRQHIDLGLNDYLPNQCPPNLIRYKAKELAFRWAMQNAGRIPELKGVDWRFALSEVEKKYNFELVGAKRNDKEIVLVIIHPGSTGIYDFQGPIDSNYAQSHGILGYV